MKRIAFAVVALALLASAPVLSQTWHWQVVGGQDPAATLTSEGAVAWTYNGGVSGSAYWESMPLPEGGTALRIVDNSATGKPRWDGTANCVKNDVAGGFTLAFRIKAESCGAETPTMMQFVNHLSGATTNNKLTLKIATMPDTHVGLLNSDRGTWIGRMDDRWHDYRSLHSVNGDGSVHYRIYWDGVLVDEYDRTSSSTGNKFGVDSGSGTAVYALAYFAYSVDGAWDSVQLPSPGDFFISSGPWLAIAPDKLSATIEWATNLPDTTSSVHYGNTSVCSQVVTEPGPGGATAHSVTIPLELDKFYYYYVESTHAAYGVAQSAQGTFDTYEANANLDNAGFDVNGLFPWVKFGSFDGLQTGWAVPARSPLYWAGSVASGTTGGKSMAGLYQQVGTTPGSFYEANAYIWTRRQAALDQNPSQPQDVSCRIGIDPSGGTDPNSEAIAWGAWEESDQSCTDYGGGNGAGGPWKQIGAAVKATGTQATVFLQQQFKWGLEWNIAGFDDTSFTVAPPPPSDIPRTRQLRDGYPAALQGKVVTGVYQNPETLEQFFYIEEADRSGGIKVRWDSPVSVGELRDVTGTVTTSNGEKIIVADSVGPETPSTGDLPGPAAANNRAAVSSFARSGAVIEGLLVKIWGRVRYCDATWLYVDDGTDYNDTTTLTWENYPVKGIRVMHNGASVPENQYVQVVGCLGNMLFSPVGEPPPPPFVIPIVWANSVTMISE